MATAAAPKAFTMVAAREAVESGLTHIERQVDALEDAVIRNPALAFDLAKTLIESTCRTILKERAQQYSPDDDLPKLFKAASNVLPFLPAALPTQTHLRNSLKKTIGGMSTTIQGVCELRNECGFASHGSDGDRPLLESVQAMLVAQSADAIVGFLFRVHRQDVARSAERLEYEKNAEFNEAVDERNGPIFIWFGSGDAAYALEYDPSRVLFDVDIEAYRDALAKHSKTEIESDEEVEPEAVL